MYQEHKLLMKYAVSETVARYLSTLEIKYLCDTFVTSIHHF